jgi:hypothetical protein
MLYRSSEQEINMRLVTHEENYPIQPAAIDASRHFFGAFNNTETEISAGWLIRFFQHRGESWKPFTHEEIEAYYGRTHNDGFTFNRLVESEAVFTNPAKEFGHMARHASLCRNMDVTGASLAYALESARRPAETKEVGGGWIVAGPNGIYFVTDDFINRCHESSPVRSN